MAGVVGVLGAGPPLEHVHAVHSLAEVAPEGLLGGHEQHVAVGGLVDLVADALPHAGQAGLAPLVVVGGVAGHHVGRTFVGLVGLDAVPVHVGGGIGLGHLQRRTLTGLPGADDSGKDAQGGHHRADVDAHVGQYGDAGEPLVVDHRLDQASPRVVGDAVAGHVAVRAGGAVAGQGAEHDPWVDGQEILEAQAQLGQRPRTHGLHHHVGLPDQVAVDLQAVLGLEIQADAPLATVGVEVEQRVALDDGPGHLPDVVAGRRFDLDHVGPQVGQERGHQARSEQGALHHLDSGQWPVGVCAHDRAASPAVGRPWCLVPEGTGQI